ncbi:MAG TPA: response regulator [Anaeromyxobacteraceae bacterium]|nr:response regulator [Anaeromyxobacteraceae bacterium]
MTHQILFVDDEPEVLSLLRKTFTEADGYVTLTASGGEEAVAILEARPIDLLVTDQRMPGITGIELAARARALRPDLTVILLTAYTDPRDLLDAINKGGVYRYLVKPWDTADLRLAVSQALEQVSLKRERARLYADMERRQAALQAASDVARDVGVAESHLSLLERLVERLPRVVPCDVAVALLVPELEAPVLLIRPVAALADTALLAAREDVLDAWAALGGAPPAESELQLRVSGGGGAGVAAAFSSRLTVPVHLAGKPAGVVVLESARPDAFNEGDARVLDLLVNEVGAAFTAFADKVLGERHRLERVVEGMADGLLVVPASGEEAIANPAARRMLGAADEGPVPVRWLKDALGFYPFDLVRGLAPASGGRAFVAEEVRLLDRTLSSVVTPVLDREGRLAGVTVVLRDVSEQKRLEERKEEFVQVMSHELRTPLTSVAGALDLVLSGLAGELSPKQTRYLRLARESSEKLNQLVDDLLDMSRLARGKERMQAEVVHLDELVSGTTERYQPAATAKGLSLQVELPAEPVRALGDANRLGQVLSNLLTNAVKFTPEGGTIQVRLFVSPAVTGAAALTVWNTGEPIPAPDLERIFEKFEQARTERTRQVSGTGLGLSISRSIVEAHGGAIWAESGAEGVRFVAVLPLEPPAGAPAPSEPPAAGEAPVALVVDQPDAAVLVRAALALRGFRVHVVTTPEDALGLARRVRPAVVVYDPGPGGVALGEVIRHDADTRHAALLAFSGGAAREAAFRAGADRLLARPCTLAQIGEAAEELLRHGRSGGARVLVVDDDAGIRAICAEVLQAHGFTVDEAGDRAGARRLLEERRPQLVLLDVALPDGDGFGLLEELAPERAREPFGVVFLSARGETADKVRGLRLGADDYLTKPFDAQELVARVDAVIRRRESALQASPMTRLPGGQAIDQEVEKRIAAQVPFALSYLDLDNLKAYNDTYGYAKADGVLLQTAAILREVVGARGGPGAFLGHVGGDDFVLLTEPERAGAVCGEAIAAFDRVIQLYYDRVDRERGYIEAADRFGTRRRFGFLALSAATVVASPGRFASHAELARAAAELKHQAKKIQGSVHLVDAGGAAAVPA